LRWRMRWMVRSSEFGSRMKLPLNFVPKIRFSSVSPASATLSIVLGLLTLLLGLRRKNHVRHSLPERE